MIRSAHASSSIGHTEKKKPTTRPLVNKRKLNRVFVHLYCARKIQGSVELWSYIFGLICGLNLHRKLFARIKII